MFATPLDIARAAGKRREQDPGPWQVAAQPSGHRGVDGGAPTSTEALAQGMVGASRAAGLLPPPGRAFTVKVTPFDEPLQLGWAVTWGGSGSTWNARLSLAAAGPGLMDIARV